VTQVSDFQRGERVAHIRFGDGTVTLVDDCVHVRYDREMKASYDADWFRAHPTYLFHRTDPKVNGE